MKDNIILIKEEINESLKKFIGIDPIDILHIIREDVQGIMNSHFNESYYRESFPITFSNEMGDWEIHEDGTCYLQAKRIIQSIKFDFTLTKTGEIKYKQ